ncbi:glycosyltransferase family 2 protein [Mesobacillus sp. LC4]
MGKLNNTPLVSVVVPVFNAEQYLGKTLECISNQTYENYEFLFVDDHSTDSSADVLKIASKKNNRIKFIERDRLPKGAPTCRNIGLSKAKGKYIIYIDCDDIFSKTFLEDRVNFMEAHTYCDYATFRGSTVIQNENQFKYGGKIWGEPVSNDTLWDFLSVNYPFSIWNNIYRLDIFRDVLWDEKLKVYQDFDFAVMVILKNYKHEFVHNSKFDYYYRIGLKNNLSAEFISEGKFESTKYLFNKIWLQISNLSDSDKYKKAFTKFFILQYTRLLHNGTGVQQRDYLKFCEKHLNKIILKKMKVTLKMYTVFSNVSNNKQLIAKLIIALFYYPKNIASSVLNKVIVNKKSG